MGNERVSTDIKGLDEMLQGGFLPQTANLVEGPPGTGKSTLGMQFIYNGIHYHDEVVLQVYVAVLLFVNIFHSFGDLQSQLFSLRMSNPSIEVT